MSNAAIRFEVSVNGAVRCVAGVGEYGVLSAIVGWLRRAPDKIPERARQREGFSEQEWLEQKIDLNLGGLDSASDTHVSWLAETLKPGDVVTIRVLGAGPCDAPGRTVSNPVMSEEAQDAARLLL